MSRFRIISDGEFYYVEEWIPGRLRFSGNPTWKRLKGIEWKNAVAHNQHLTEEQAVMFINKVLRKREGLKIIREL